MKGDSLSSRACSARHESDDEPDGERDAVIRRFFASTPRASVKVAWKVSPPRKSSSFADLHRRVRRHGTGDPADCYGLMPAVKIPQETEKSSKH